MATKLSPSDRYLWQRGNVWWFRMHVPVKFREVAGTRIVQESLKTSDRKAASLAAGKKRAELFEKWDTFYQGASVAPLTEVREPTQEELDIAAYDVAFEGMRREMAAHSNRKAADPAAYRVWIDGQRKTLEEYTRKYAAREWAAWSDLADRIIGTKRWLVDNATDKYHGFVEAIAKLSIEALRISLEHSTGNLGEVPKSAEVDRVRSIKSATPKDGQRLPDLFEKYEAHLRRQDAGGVASLQERKRILYQFSEFVGIARSINSITAADVRDFRDAIADAPKGYAKRSDFAGLDLKAAIIKGFQLGIAKRSTLTVNKDLSFLSAFFDWCADNSYCSSNPTVGISYKVSWVVKEENQRPSFVDAELNTLFQSPLFRKFAADGHEHVAGDITANDWRKWIPLIALFTGARTGEIAQLYTDDVLAIQDVWVLRFKAASNRNTRLKTKGSARVIPVHSLLEKIGFLEFVGDQKKLWGDVPGPLFPEIKADNRGVMGAMPSKFFGRYLKRINIKSGDDGKGMHSFRHSMSDSLRSAGFYDMEFGSAILGHSNKSMTAKYGQIPQGTLAKRKAMIEAVTFDGIDLQHLIRPEHRAAK